MVVRTNMSYFQQASPYFMCLGGIFTVLMTIGQAAFAVDQINWQRAHVRYMFRVGVSTIPHYSAPLHHKTV